MDHRLFIVIEEYESSNEDPIELEAGDRVKVGQAFEDNQLWPNWISCVSLRTGKWGWTPAQILERDGDTGVATAAYTAREMTVAVGDMVRGSRELNGWIWCLGQWEGQMGWVPKSCLRPVSPESGEETEGFP